MSHGSRRNRKLGNQIRVIRACDDLIVIARKGGREELLHIFRHFK